MDQPSSPLDAVFADSDFTVRGIYEQLIAAMRPFGPVAEEPRKEAVHLFATGGPMFAAATPAHDRLLLCIRTIQAIPSGRMRKIEQKRDQRFENELALAVPGDVDEELLGWLRTAYELAAPRRGG